MGHVDYSEVLEHPEQWLTDLQQRWLQPAGIARKSAYALIYSINWILVRLLFRVRVEGLQHLRIPGPVIVTPNHSSPLDPPVLAATLPLSMLQQTFWAGKASTVLKNRLRRVLSRLTRVIPIAEERSALGAAVCILEQGSHLVWFPEGTRSLDGRLQRFRHGIALILTRCDVPVVPIYIQGAFDAFPTRGGRPRLWSPIIVRIGPPVSARDLGLTSSANPVIEAVTETLQKRVAELNIAES